MDVEAGKREVLDCRTCERPDISCEMCPITTGDQPQPTPETEFIISLWHRVNRYKILPDPGGLLDQEEQLMQQLDLINNHVDSRRAREAKAREGN